MKSIYTHKNSNGIIISEQQKYTNGEFYFWDQVLFF